MTAIATRQLVNANDFSLAIAERWRDSVAAIMDIGKLLLGAKTTLSHGEFEPMIKNSLPFGMRTAQRLMTIAEQIEQATADMQEN